MGGGLQRLSTVGTERRSVISTAISRRVSSTFVGTACRNPAHLRGARECVATVALSGVLGLQKKKEGSERGKENGKKKSTRRLTAA